MCKHDGLHGQGFHGKPFFERDERCAIFGLAVAEYPRRALNITAAADVSRVAHKQNIIHEVNGAARSVSGNGKHAKLCLAKTDRVTVLERARDFNAGGAHWK